MSANSDEYVPTTIQIRRGWCGETVSNDEAESGAEFDRWLAAHESALTEKVRRDALEEAALVCERIQDDPEFINPGQGVAAAKIVLRGMADPTAKCDGTPECVAPRHLPPCWSYRTTPQERSKP